MLQLFSQGIRDRPNSNVFLYIITSAVWNFLEIRGSQTYNKNMFTAGADACIAETGSAKDEEETQKFIITITQTAFGVVRSHSDRARPSVYTAFLYLLVC